MHIFKKKERKKNGERMMLLLKKKIARCDLHMHAQKKNVGIIFMLRFGTKGLFIISILHE